MVPVAIKKEKKIKKVLHYVIPLHMRLCVNFSFNRCASDTGQAKPVLTFKDSPKKNSDTETGNIASLFPGNVSVSIDDGETAVVVSFHKGSTDNCERGKESESDLLLKESEMISKDQEFPLVLSPICEPVSEESMLSGTNLKSGMNEEIKIEICNGPVALETKPGIFTMV